MTTCGHYSDEAGECGGTLTRRYLTGERCKDHTPAALNGRPEVTPDPTRTLEAVRRARGTVDAPAPMGSSAGIDRAAIRSGKRRSSPQVYREAQQ